MKSILKQGKRLAMRQADLHVGAQLILGIVLRARVLIRLVQEAVEAISSILGMAASEGSDAVPPNARSHTLLLAGKLIGDAQVEKHLPLHAKNAFNMPLIVCCILVEQSRHADLERGRQWPPGHCPHPSHWGPSWLGF